MRMLLVLLLVLPLAAQTTPKAPQKTPSTPKPQYQNVPTTPNGVVGRGPMVSGPTQQVAMQEVRLRDAIMAGDSEAISKMVSDGYVATGTDGAISGKKEVLELGKLGDVSTPVMRLTDMQVRQFGPSLAIVTGQAELKGVTGVQEVIRLYRYTRVWQKQPGMGWKLVAFQATELPRPPKLTP